jgi:RNA polymerase sigma-70 factor (sigma-E family)
MQSQVRSHPGCIVRQNHSIVRQNHSEEQPMRMGGGPLPDGAPAEFAAFVDRHCSGLGRLAYLLLGDTHAAEDLTADVLLAVWRQWNRVSQVEYPQAYLRRMVTNQAATRHRRRARERHSLERLFAAPADVRHEPDSAAVIDVRSALRRISPRRRACLVLRYAFDLSEREVAQTLGISVGAVKSQASKGLAQLRNELDDVVTETHALASSATSGRGLAGKGSPARANSRMRTGTLAPACRGGAV